MFIFFEKKKTYKSNPHNDYDDDQLRKNKNAKFLYF